MKLDFTVFDIFWYSKELTLQTIYKLHIKSWSRWRSFMRSVWFRIVYSKVVQIFLFTSSVISNVLHSMSKRRWARWYTFRKNIQINPVFAGFGGAVDASISAVDRMICCLAEPGDTTVNPPPLNNFCGLAADKSDCPGRIGDPNNHKKCDDEMISNILVVFPKFIVNNQDHY